MLNIYACEQQESENIVPKYGNGVGPPVLSDFHIKANINGSLIEGIYKSPNDTIYNGYRMSDSTFGIRRYTSLTSDQNFEISGHNINLDNLNYPQTFYSNVKLLFWRGGSLGIFGANHQDTSLFSITLTNFQNDTLTGTFAGKLFSSDSNIWSDSLINVTNGEFEILLTRY